MDYPSYVITLKKMLLVDSVQGGINLDAILKDMINYAELRMYREFNFLATQTSNHDAITTPAVRRVPVPESMIIVEGCSIIVPAGLIPTDLHARRIPLLEVSREFLDAIWPIATDTAPPVQFETYYAMYGDAEPAVGMPELPQAAIIGPTPDAAYHVEFTGVERPPPLSATNPETILTKFFPDEFLTASLIFGGQWQRNPELAATYELQYQNLARGISIEEARKVGLDVPYGQTPPGGGPAPRGGGGQQAPQQAAG